MPDSRVLVLPVVVLFTKTANNEIEYYPLWIDRMNLRFVYRMYKEKHTRKLCTSCLTFSCTLFVGETNLFMVQR